MGMLTTILMLVFFPLNFLLALQGEWVQGEEQIGQVGIQELALQGQVKGVEKSIEEQTQLVAAPAPVKLAPVRKTGVADLVLPNSHASVILDADSGEILQSGDAHEKRQIASLTKIMTAVLVIERIKNLEEPITIDEEEVYIEGTKIGCPRSGYCISPRLKVGEQVKAGDLLKAMLMNSANDAAVALGKHIGGSQAGFAEIMNAKAKSMGLKDTNFCTPSGLELDGREAECYSSAHDIAKVAAYSLRYDQIWKAFRLPNNTIITSLDEKTTHTILNTDLVMDQIPNLLGAKTGFTPLAGYSLLMAATDPTGKHTVVAVLLDDPNRWLDIKTMVSWAFKSHDWN